MSDTNDKEAREKEIKRRAGAGQASLPFTRADEKIVELVTTGDALYIVTNYAMFRVYTPDDIDPEVVGRNIPWVVTRIFPYGTTEDVVARSLIQIIRANGKLIVRNEKQQAAAAMGLRVATALLECKSAYDAAKKDIENVIDEVQKNYDSLKAGPGTVVLPHLPNFDGIVKSFFGSAKRCINEIVEVLQEVFQIKKIDRGNFTKTINAFQPKSDFEKELKNALLRLDETVKYVLEARNAIEHPKKTHLFESRDFFLDHTRNISRPSWKLTHPKYGEDTWFDFISNGKDIIQGLTLIAEGTALLVAIANADHFFEVSIKQVSEADRDPEAPCHFEFTILQPAKK